MVNEGFLCLRAYKSQNLLSLCFKQSVVIRTVLSWNKMHIGEKQMHKVFYREYLYQHFQPTKCTHCVLYKAPKILYKDKEHLPKRGTQ